MSGGVQRREPCPKGAIEIETRAATPNPYFDAYQVRLSSTNIATRVLVPEGVSIAIDIIKFLGLLGVRPCLSSKQVSPDRSNGRGSKGRRGFLAPSTLYPMLRLFRPDDNVARPFFGIPCPFCERIRREQARSALAPFERSITRTGKLPPHFGRWGPASCTSSTATFSNGDLVVSTPTGSLVIVGEYGHSGVGPSRVTRLRALEWRLYAQKHREAGEPPLAVRMLIVDSASTSGGLPDARCEPAPRALRLGSLPPYHCGLHLLHSN